MRLLDENSCCTAAAPIANRMANRMASRTRVGCDSHAMRGCGLHECGDGTVRDETRRDGTEHHPDFSTHEFVTDTRTPVDKSDSVRSWTPEPDVWLTADEWFLDFITKLQRSKRRVDTMLRRERGPIPVADALARDYADKTEQLRRFLRGERPASKRLIELARTRPTERKVS